MILYSDNLIFGKMDQINLILEKNIKIRVLGDIHVRDFIIIILEISINLCN